MERRKSRLKTLAMYMILEFGALIGVPMRPDEIERMTRQLNNAVTLVADERERDDAGDPPEPPAG